MVDEGGAAGPEFVSESGFAMVPGGGVMGEESLSEGAEAPGVGGTGPMITLGSVVAPGTGVASGEELEELEELEEATGGGGAGRDTGAIFSDSGVVRVLPSTP